MIPPVKAEAVSTETIGDADLIKSVNHAGIVRVVRPADVVRVPLLKERHVALDLSVSGARCRHRPLRVVVPTDKLNNVPVDRQPGGFINAKRAEAKALDDFAVAKPHGHRMEVGRRWRPQPSVRDLDTRDGDGAIGRHDPAVANGGATIKCERETNSLTRLLRLPPNGPDSNASDEEEAMLSVSDNREHSSKKKGDGWIERWWSQRSIHVHRQHYSAEVLDRQNQGQTSSLDL